MADYFQPTVVQQTIPIADMTPLEILLLTRIFQSEPDGDGLYFFAELAPNMMISASREELERALTLSPDIESAARRHVTEQLAVAQAEIDLDLSVISWEPFLQDIVKRSKTLAYISVVAAFICSKMRAGGFGGMATLITPDAILGKSTNDFLEEFFVEARLVETAAAASSRST